MSERLQKILARAGFGSRRAAESLITGGRVAVNGAVVTQLGAQADADVDQITVDGEAIGGASEQVYLAMHKPAGVISIAIDTHGRRTVMELLPPGLPPHVLPVGRLDRDTEGLLLFTNDGEFAHRVTHPRYELDKEYIALVSGVPAADSLDRLRAGIEIEGGVTAPAQVELAEAPPGYGARGGHTWLRIVIHEGRKRQVRLMCAAIGNPVRALVRVRVGGVLLAGLPLGETRPLSDDELRELRRLVGLAPT